MDHGIAHFNARSEPVEQQPSGEALERWQQFRGNGEIRIVGMDGNRQLAFERTKYPLQVRHVPASNEKRGGTEHFILQAGVAKKLLGIR